MSTTLSAGIDFGSSVAKIAVTDGTTTKHDSFGWREYGLDRRSNRSWWIALQRCLDTIQTCATEFNGDVDRLICTTIGPNFAFISDGNNRSWTSGPIQQYDNWPASACGDEALRERALRMLDDLRARSDITDTPRLLSGAAWLAWLLTRETAHDEVGFLEAGLDQGLPTNVPVPSRSLTAADAVGPLLAEHAVTREALAGATVHLGASDSTALALKAEAAGVENLVYCGTFFTLLELTGSISRWVREASGTIPYEWHVSMPIGAYLESSALNSLSTEPISRLIADALDRAETEVDYADLRAELEVQAAVQFETWKVGTSAFAPPTSLGSHRSSAERDARVLVDFANRVSDAAANRSATELGLAGGLAHHSAVQKVLQRVPVTWAQADFHGASFSLELLTR